MAAMVVAAVSVMVGLGKVDATTGLVIITTVAGVKIAGGLVGKTLGAPTDATGSGSSTTTTPASSPVVPPAVQQPPPTVDPRTVT